MPMSEQPESSSIRVKIYDREYGFRIAGDPERFKAVCANLDKRMREVAASTGSVDTLKVAVLAALSLADDLYKAQEEMQKLDESLSRSALACVSILDRIKS